MNDADLPSINLDELRLVPDWLRENAPPPSKQYASYDRPLEPDGRDRRGPRPGGQGGRDRGDGRDARGPRDRRDDRPRSGAAGPRGRDPRPAFVPREPQPEVIPAPIRVEFLPDDRCMASIIKQIRTTHMAYPLFSLARMFLQEPARHYLQLSVVPGASQPGTTLCQLGEDGPVVLDRAALEKVAFEAMKERFYKEDVVQKDPPKGNFTNVARERSTGTLLGPTNYHGYQPALRSLFESRFSRRMSFDEYRRNIEVSSDPALVERWKEEARTVTTISTVQEETPVILPSTAEARNHFRHNYLDTLLHTGMSFRLHGSVARRLPEAAMMQAIREAHERELRYPAQFVQLLRQGLQNAGLHIFKHRKRIVYVAASRPTPFVPDQGAVTENVSLILQAIAEAPLCTRKALAARVLGKRAVVNDGSPGQPAAPTALRDAADPTHESPVKTAAEGGAELSTATASLELSGDDTKLEQPVAAMPISGAPVAADDELSKAKATLAADLRFLVQAGHIIEFHNGTFDLPLVPKKDDLARKSSPGGTAEKEDALEIGSDPVEVQNSASPASEPTTQNTPSVVVETQTERSLLPVHPAGETSQRLKFDPVASDTPTPTEIEPGPEPEFEPDLSIPTHPTEKLG